MSLSFEIFLNYNPTQQQFYSIPPERPQIQNDWQKIHELINGKILARADTTAIFTQLRPDLKSRDDLREPMDTGSNEKMKVPTDKPISQKPTGIQPKMATNNMQEGKNGVTIEQNQMAIGHKMDSSMNH